MLLSGYQLEILVNGLPLEECLEPISKNTTTGPSYVINESTCQKIENNNTVYAAVKEPGAHFTVRYKVPLEELSKGPIMGFVYVDGQHDNTYSAHIDLLSTHYFRDTKYHSREAIPLDLDFKTKEIPESKANIGLKLSTSFNENPLPKHTKLESKLIQTSSQPIAALHLHYRADSWLRARKLLNIQNIQNTQNSPCRSTNVLSEIFGPSNNYFRAMKTDDFVKKENLEQNLGDIKERNSGLKRKSISNSNDENSTEARKQRKSDPEEVVVLSD
ncbi:5102_t:CDS:2 [Diversispora eburnea]|uniref:5102_t:CDS:1 n=1 Tax=Diversispora eburnea TaxID=1213867 RepID=A0A9N8WN77_9GLOM|nr:5102_t:CDS:2 [Diversispora eburnea]